MQSSKAKRLLQTRKPSAKRRNDSRSLGERKFRADTLSSRSFLSLFFTAIPGSAQLGSVRASARTREKERSSRDDEEIDHPAKLVAALLSQLSSSTGTARRSFLLESAGVEAALGGVRLEVQSPSDHCLRGSSSTRCCEQSGERKQYDVSQRHETFTAGRSTPQRPRGPIRLQVAHSSRSTRPARTIHKLSRSRLVRRTRLTCITTLFPSQNADGNHPLASGTPAESFDGSNLSHSNPSVPSNSAHASEWN